MTMTVEHLLVQVTVVTHSPEVSTLTVLGQDICARSLEVQHAAIEGAIMRVSEGNAGGWTRKAVRTTQTRDDGWHLVLGAHTHRHTGTDRDTHTSSVTVAL